MDEVYGKPGKMKLPEPQLQRQLVRPENPADRRAVEGQRAEAEGDEIVSLFYDVEMPLAAMLYKMERKASGLFP